MKRQIIEIDEALCNGCAICAEACEESAIQMIDGKAKLVSDQYCDGLGNCLPTCPTGAITMVEREAAEYSQEAVDKRIAELAQNSSSDDMINVKSIESGARQCPGSAARKIERVPTKSKAPFEIPQPDGSGDSQLMNWPVQIRLLNPNADYLKGADLLVAADCTAFAHANFNETFIKDHIAMIGCPKLDDNDYNAEKLTEIFRAAQPRSITVVRMEVPCCSGILSSVKKAMLQSETIVPYKEITITVDGNVRV